MAFALGLCVSVGSFGSVINGIIVPQVYDMAGLGPALAVGFAICVFSLLNGFGMLILDRKAEKKNKKNGASNGTELQSQEEDEGFKIEYLYTFSTSFWLLSLSLVLTFMSMLPYIQNCSDLLQKKYAFDNITAGKLFGIPNIIVAIFGPFLGASIDKFGKRVLLMCLSSIILIIGFITSMLMPPCHQCYNEVYPLVLVGIGFMIYTSTIWGSIPYVVPPAAVGTAFGLATAIQNIGLCIAPVVVGYIKD